MPFMAAILLLIYSQRQHHPRPGPWRSGEQCLVVSFLLRSIFASYAVVRLHTNCSQRRLLPSENRFVALDLSYG